MLVFSEYQTDTIDLALDFMAELPERTMNLALAFGTILLCILLPRKECHFNKENPPRGQGSLSPSQK